MTQHDTMTHHTSIWSQPSNYNYSTLTQSIETFLNKIFLMLFIGSTINYYPLNFVLQALDI